MYSHYKPQYTRPYSDDSKIEKLTEVITEQNKQILRQQDKIERLMELVKLLSDEIRSLRLQHLFEREKYLTKAVTTNTSFIFGQSDTRLFSKKISKQSSSSSDSSEPNEKSMEVKQQSTPSSPAGSYTTRSEKKYVIVKKIRSPKSTVSSPASVIHASPASVTSDTLSTENQKQDVPSAKEAPIKPSDEEKMLKSVEDEESTENKDAVKPKVESPKPQENNETKNHTEDKSETHKKSKRSLIDEFSKSDIVSNYEFKLEDIFDDTISEPKIHYEPLESEDSSSEVSQNGMLF